MEIIVHAGMDRCTPAPKNKTDLHPEKNASLFAYRALKIARVKL